MEEARKQHIEIQGHVPDRVTAWEATEAKQKSIEHLLGMPYACSSREKELWPRSAKTQSMLEGDRIELDAFRSYSQEKCDRLFREFIRNGTWAVPTLSVYKTFGLLNDAELRSDTRMRYFGGEFRDWLSAKDDPRLKSWTRADFELERDLFKQEQRLFGELFRAGVPLLAGTDTGNPYCFPGFSLHDELVLLVESGLTPLAALQAATRNAAIFMNAEDRYGSISKGKIADLVLLDADPLQDIRNTTKIAEVFFAGRELDRAALDWLLKSAEEEANKEQKLTFDGEANQSSTTSSSHSKDDLKAFPGQNEGDFIIKDFRFNSGEVLTELRLHYVTLGTPHRNASGEIDNAVLLLHSTGGDTTEFFEPSLSGPLYGPGEPMDLNKFYYDYSRRRRARQIKQAERRASSTLPALRLQRHGHGSVSSRN
jgi:hypothetical protein